MDEVVAPPAEPADPQPADGGASAWPWIAGGLAAAALLALTARRMRRRSPGFPKPAEG